VPEWFSQNYKQLFTFLAVPLRAPTTIQGAGSDDLTAQLLKNQVLTGCGVVSTDTQLPTFSPIVMTSSSLSSSPIRTGPLEFQYGGKG
jgi:hypothetical protein